MKEINEIYDYMRDNGIMPDESRWLITIINSMKKLRTIGIAEELSWDTVKKLYTGGSCLLCLHITSSILIRDIDLQTKSCCPICPWMILEGHMCSDYDDHEASIERYNHWLASLKVISNYSTY